MTPVGADAPAGAARKRGPVRRGLVLQGGGAKGAFQYGVLKELHARGMRFDAVAGTSVGALNGAIVAAGAWELGDQLWGDLALAKVFRWTWLSRSLAALTSLGRLYLSYVDGPYATLLPRPLRGFFHLLTLVPSLSFLAGIGAMLFASGQRWGVVWVGALAVASAVGVTTSVDARRRIFYSAFSLFLVLPPGLLLTYLVDNGPGGLFVLLQRVVAKLRDTPTSVPLVVAAVGLCVIASSLLYVVGWLAKRSGIELFGNEPLRDIVRGVVQSGFKVPLIATAGKEVPEYYDPDDYSYVRSTPRGPYFEAAQRTAFYATYERVDLLPRDEAVTALVTSAALPLGVVAATRDSAGKTLVDGGVVDNTPWFPFVELYRCDEIVLVLCGPPDAEAEVSAERWRVMERLRHVLERDFRPPRVSVKQIWEYPSSVQNTPPTVVPFRNDVTMPRVVATIAPDRPLGNFLTATLNFDVDRARENVRYGREIASRALAGFAL